MVVMTGSSVFQRCFKMADVNSHSEAERNNFDNQETDEEKLEKLHFKKVVEAFLFYK